MSLLLVLTWPRRIKGFWPLKMFVLTIVICLSCQCFHGLEGLKAFDQSGLVYAGLYGDSMDGHLSIDPS